MESVKIRLNKLREERIAREKSRLDKLRELNLKKYNKNEPQITPRPSLSASLANKSVKNAIKPTSDIVKNNISKCTNYVKNNIQANGFTKRPVSIPTFVKPEVKSNIPNKTIESKMTTTTVKVTEVRNGNKTVTQCKEKKDFVSSNKIISKPDAKLSVSSSLPKHELKMPRKSVAPVTHANPIKSHQNLEVSRKSLLPTKKSETNSRMSVFDRLYQPKTVQKTEIRDAERLHKDPLFLQKILHQGSLIANKRHTVFEPKLAKIVPTRRSISAVHFKRISKKELGNCIQKWSSIGDKLNEVHLTNINEDDSVKQDVITSAVKSERKKVRLQTPVANFYTPRPEELQSRLTKWLKSRGKSIDSYQHLQCFGVHHLTDKTFKPLNMPSEPVNYDDEEENKENMPLEHDSDNDSYTDNLNDRKDDFKNAIDYNWRSRVSYVSDSTCLNESPISNTTLNSDEILPVDDLVVGALNDLNELLREGFDWEQCARWLRALRERCPHAPALAAYWECRAALEERRGDLPASVQCWEEAIATGTQHSVADANLDQLLDKFMQLKISPNSGKRERVDPKLLDVKNVFKSTIIRFAVQQAKLRQSNQQDQPKYTMTPVRRSSRLSVHWSSKKTPLKLCSSVKQADMIGEDVVFVPNPKLCDTP